MTFIRLFIAACFLSILLCLPRLGLLGCRLLFTPDYSRRFQNSVFLMLPGGNLPMPAVFRSTSSSMCMEKWAGLAYLKYDQGGKYLG